MVLSLRPRDIALEYLERHRLAPIPLPAGQKVPPRIKWKSFQTHRPSRAQVMAWWGQHAADGIAIVCGARLGLCVVDIDPRNHGPRSLTGVTFPRGPVVLTPRGGWHHYFHLDGARTSRPSPGSCRVSI